MKTQLFKVGNRVFDILHGWGEVVEINNKELYYPVIVSFNNGERILSYTFNGFRTKEHLTPVLSFTEYTLRGFSQERLVDYNKYIGK